MANVPGTNTGHGHVWARPDGSRARCGGPRMCKECARDAAEVASRTENKGARRIEELEIAIRAALSFVQGRHADPNDGYARMVIAALRGALAKD